MAKNKKPTAKSPWARSVEQDLTDIPVEEDQGFDQAACQVKVGEELIHWLGQQRESFIDLFFSTQYPAIPNKISALRFLQSYMALFDDLIEGASQLIEGGRTPEDIAHAMTLYIGEEFEPTRYNEAFADIKAFEMAKASTDEEAVYRDAVIMQFMRLVDIYQAESAAADIDDDNTTEIMETLDTGFEEFLDEGRFPDIKVRETINHWPGVNAIKTLVQQMANLFQESFVASAALSQNPENLQDPRTSAISDYVDAVNLITGNVVNNMMMHLEHRTYFYPMFEFAAMCSKLYGDKAEDPETKWELDDNILLQIQAQTIIKEIVQELVDTGVYNDDPEFLAYMALAGHNMIETFEEKFPAKEEFKPPFIKEAEAEEKRRNDREQVHAARADKRSRKNKPR